MKARTIFLFKIGDDDDDNVDEDFGNTKTNYKILNTVIL